MGSSDSDTIGLIAGGGQFPFLVAEGARKAGRPVACVGFSGHTDPALAEQVEHFQQMHLGQIAKCLKFLKSHGADKVIFAGSISKPKAMDIRPDWLAAKLLFKLGGKGDDAILSALCDELENQGLPVVSALELLPGIATPAGPLTRKPPRKHELDDLRLAWPKAKAIGTMDIGQTLVVKSGIVAAVEGPEGTDAALRRAGELVGKGCILCKVFKPGQDTRIDLPAAGLSTVQTLVDIGGTCLAIEAHKSIFFDLPQSIALAEKHNIRIIGLTPDQLDLPADD